METECETNVGSERRTLCEALARSKRARQVGAHLWSSAHRSRFFLGLHTSPRETGNLRWRLFRKGKHGTDIDLAKHVSVLARCVGRSIRKSASQMIGSTPHPATMHRARSGSVPQKEDRPRREHRRSGEAAGALDPLHHRHRSRAPLQCRTPASAVAPPTVTDAVFGRKSI
jgi:hypothetical protein